MFKKLISSLMLCGSISAFAYDTTPGSIEAGVYAGYTWLGHFKDQEPKNNLLYGARFGVFLTDQVSLESSYHFVKSKTERAATPQVDADFQNLRFNLLYHLFPSSRLTPFVTGGLGWLRSNVQSVFKEDDLSVNAGLGLKAFVTNSLAIRADGRYVYAEVLDQRNHNYEAMLGLSYFFGAQKKRDADHDGVSDKKDECASTPAGASVNEKGCPDDSDKDGVLNGIDQCDNTIVRAIVDAKGCPTDADADGVVDGIDQCADTAKESKVDEKGCVLVVDADSDGVNDALDQCKETPKGVEVDVKGCPKDTDADTVLDYIDLCPNTPAGVKIDDKGCPLLVKSKGVLKGVNFQSNSAILLPASLPVLDDVAKELTEFSSVKVEVQGHTDSIGNPIKNKTLSQSRAQSVVDYLIGKGIAKDRLIAKGYGKDLPMGSNKTKVGRAQNRRVELKWIE